MPALGSAVNVLLHWVDRIHRATGMFSPHRRSLHLSHLFYVFALYNYPFPHIIMTNMKALILHVYLGSEWQIFVFSSEEKVRQGLPFLHFTT